MVDDVQKGYEYYIEHSAGVVGAMYGAAFGADRADYVASVETEIDALEKGINDFLGTKTAPNILKGDIAEFWHAGTYNVNAAINRSATRMSVDRSHDFGSADVSGSDGQLFGLKYYGDGEHSAKAQAISIFQRFKEYQASGGKDSLEKYLTDRGYTDIDAVLNDPVYHGQFRIIPKDQMEDAAEWLKKMIKTEGARRPDQVKRYQDTLAMLRDKITDSEGNSSIALSREESEQLARLAKEGRFDASEFGITAPELLNFEMVMKEAMKAGTNAAVISLVLKVGLEIYKAISFLIKNGEIEESEFRRIGFAAVSGSAEGFIRGSVAAAITTCCKSGILGETLKGVNPSVVGAITVLAINAVKNASQVAIGKKSKSELATELTRDMLVSTCALIGGGISQAAIEIPVIGYMVGSLVGTLVGTFVYNTGYKATISFCVNSGFTMFGLVDQDYSLPDEIIEEIGIDTFNYDTFMPESFEADTFEPESFEYNTFEPDNLEISFLRRGVIGISKIGYLEE